MVGAQTAHTELQRSLIEINRNLKPVIEIDYSSYTEESIRDFQEAPEDLSVLVLKPGKAPSYKVSSYEGKVSEALAIKRGLEEEIVRHLGVNPFSAGAPLNVDLATEVTAIQGQSGLTAQSISTDLSKFLSCSFQKLVRIGALYDEKPFKVRLNEDVVTFGPQFEIEPILREDVPCQVTPGTFETEYTKVAKGMQLAKVFLEDPIVRQNYPKLVQYIWKSILVNYNVRDVDSLLKPDPETQQKLELVKQVPIEVLIQALHQVFPPPKTATKPRPQLHRESGRLD